MIYCSFGPNCHAAQLLKRLNLKTASYPFDWIFSTPSMIIDCLADRFSHFLDPQYCVGDAGREGNTHTYYFPDSSLTMFNHRNPLKTGDHEYYIRCVDRFYEFLAQTEEPKTFVFLFLDKKTYIDEKIEGKVREVYDTTVEDIVRFDREFAKYTKNYRILCIFQHIGDTRRHLWTKEGNIDFLHLETVSKSGGNYFLDEEDNMYLDDLCRKQIKNEMGM